MIRDVEKAAKQIRNEVRKQYDATPKVLDQAASQLRRGAAEAAYQVERYIREVRMDLESGAKSTTKKRTAKKRATKKRTTKKRRATKKSGARKTAKRATKKRARKR
jgi:hypothetical protein